MSRNIFAVIMAGGRGERFWPQSRASRPKQLLRLLGNLTLIEQTVDRLKGIVPPENCLIVSNAEYVPAMRSLLKEIPLENIIGEPIGRDTGPCVALAAGLIRQRTGGDPDAALIVLPADHVINDLDQFHRVLADAVQTARAEAAPVVIGVPPTYPATGYGYIKCAQAVATGTRTHFRVGESFHEKPVLSTAQKFLESGEYCWNSGIFFWTLAVLDAAMRDHAPQLWAVSECIAEAAAQGRFTTGLAECYEQAPRISIDYAVMEHIDRMLVAECTFDWDDVGSWTALRNQMRPREGNNIVSGLFAGLDAHDCVVVGESDHLIAAIDVQDLIIVETGDATLVCHARSAQRVKDMVQYLSRNPQFKKFV